MILASATGLGRQYTGDPIFTDLGFEIRAGERIGLVGPNGAGKTTLMRLLAGLDEPDMGRLNVRPGVRVSLLRQQPDFDPTRPCSRSPGRASPRSWNSRTSWRRPPASWPRPTTTPTATGPPAATPTSRTGSSTRTPTRSSTGSRRSSTGPRLRPADFHRPAGTFSGGQQSRLMLARLLLESPDLMLLDEPTNHLDVATISWLEGYLSRQPTGMVIVSHDRYFLDATVTRIWELYQGRVDVYPGNYSQYWTLREERAKVLERQAEKQAERGGPPPEVHRQVQRRHPRHPGQGPREEARTPPAPRTSS